VLYQVFIISCSFFIFPLVFDNLNGVEVVDNINWLPTNFLQRKIGSGIRIRAKGPDKSGHSLKDFGV